MQSGDWTPEHSQALREYVARGMSFARDRGGDQCAVRDRLYAQCRHRPRQADAGSSDRSGTGIGRALRRPAHRGSRGQAEIARQSGRQTAATGTGQRPGRSRRASPTPLRRHRPHGSSHSFELEPGDCRYPYGGDKDDEPIAFCGHPRRAGSSYCTPHFHLTRGVGTEAERAAGSGRCCGWLKPHSSSHVEQRPAPHAARLCSPATSKGTNMARTQA